ncbi:hypothetical protein MBLNU230_g3721t1 [Neophaeotheca triangularis]
MATDVRIHVVKYSHAIGVNPDRSVPWSHLTVPELFMLLQGKNQGTSRDQHLMLTVVRCNTESVDLGSYIDETINERARFEHSGISPALDQLPIFGMTQGVCLAFRYKLPDGEARRIQMKLESETLCRQAVAVLMDRGMEFTQMRPGAARPTSARPSTASTVRPSSMLGAADGLKSSSRLGPKSSSSKEYQSHDIAMPRLSSRDEVAAPRTVVTARPSAAQTYRSGSTAVQAQTYDTLQTPTSTNLGFTNSRPPMLPARESVKYSDASHQARANMPPPELITAHSNEHVSSETLDHNGHSATSSDVARLGQSHYFTASSNDDMDVPFPPKRDLPFKRPGSRQSGESSSSRPGSSALSLPPLPEPKVVQQRSVSPTRPNTAYIAKSARAPSPARPATASPLKRVAAALEEERPFTPNVQAGGASTQQQLTSTHANPTTSQVDNAEGPSRRYSRLDELLNGSQVPRQQSRPSRLNSLADAPGEFVSPPQTARSHHLPAVTSVGINAATSGMSSAVQAAEQQGGDEYLAQNPEDRQAALETYILSKMEDPVFAALCQDVENSWRRIALGM